MTRTKKYERIINRIGVNIGMRNRLFLLLNFTWGIFDNLIGLMVFMILAVVTREEIYFHEKSIVLRTKMHGGWGFNFGIFVVVSEDIRKTLYASDAFLLNHEYGHAVQNCIFGPLMLFIVDIPSIVRYWCRNIRKTKNKALKGGYYDIWFEKTATIIGDNTVRNLHPFEDQMLRNNIELGLDLINILEGDYEK